MADKRIDELEEALTITSDDLFVLEQANTAKKLTGQTMTTFLTALADGHGGIQSIVKTSSTGTNPVIDTYTVTFADTSTTTFNVTNGVKGDRGATGPQGPKGDDVTIVSQSVQYQAWSSGTEYPTGTWLDSVPSVSQGGYLWTRTIVTYSDDTQTVAYSVARMGVDGSGAVSTVNNVQPDGSGNVQLTASDVNALPTSYQAPVTSVNGMNGDVVIPAAVASVNGKTGAVVLDADDVEAQPLFKMNAELTSAGWYRLVSYGSDNLATVLEFKVFIPESNGSGTESGEIHSIAYPTTYGGTAVFSREYSAGETRLINRIRRTYGGTKDGVPVWCFDIHYNGSSARQVYAEVKINGNYNADHLWLEDLAAVADAPSGESVFPEKSLAQRTEGDIASLFSINKTSGGSCSITSAYRIGNLVSLFVTTTTSGAVSTGSDIYVGTLSGPLPKCGAITNGYYSNRAIIGRIESDGTIRFRVTGASGDSVPSGQNSYFFFNYLTE